MGAAVSPQKRTAIWERDLRSCHYCGDHLSLAYMTCDHVVPRFFGGPNTFWNLVACCPDCNVGWAHTIRKCACEICDLAFETFLRQRHLHRSSHEMRLGLGMPRPGKRRKPAPTVAGVVSEIESRVDRIDRALARLPAERTHQAAAMRGVRSGFRQAVDLLLRVNDDETRTHQAVTQHQDSDESEAC